MFIVGLILLGLFIVICIQIIAGLAETQASWSRGRRRFDPREVAGRKAREIQQLLENEGHTLTPQLRQQYVAEQNRLWAYFNQGLDEYPDSGRAFSLENARRRAKR